MDQQLYDAVNNEPIEKIAALIRKGASVNYVTSAYQDTPLFRAATRGDAGIVTMLLDSSANPNVTNKFGTTPLHSAAWQGSEGSVAALLSRQANVDSVNRDNETALHMAAKKDHRSIVQQLLQRGANYQIRDKHGHTAEQLCKRDGTRALFRAHAATASPSSPTSTTTTSKPTASSSSSSTTTSTHDNHSASVVPTTPLECECEALRLEVARLSKVAQQSAFILKAFSRSTQFDPSSLRVAELHDFELGGRGFRFVAHGCNGSVCFTRAAPYNMARGVRFPQKTVAIKALFNYRSSESARLATVALQSKFDREYLVPLQYPHWTIVNVYNYFRALCVPSLLVADPSQYDPTLFFENTTYFTMEACETTLDRWCLKRRSSSSSDGTGNYNSYYFNPRTEARIVLMIVLQLLLALEHLDRHSVRHLDLKLDNLFVIACRGGVDMAETPQVVLGDFGTAFTGDTVNSLDSAVEGNQANRPPEVVRPTDERQVNVSKADLWAVGCVLYELVEGRHPFWDQAQPDSLALRICYLPLPQLTPAWKSAAAVDDAERAAKQAIEALLYEMLLVREPERRSTAKDAIARIEHTLWGGDQPLEQLESELYDELTGNSSRSSSSTTASQPSVVPMTIEQMLRARNLVARRFHDYFL